MATHSTNSGARPTVAVIGGGFSGLLTALHLARAPDGPCVRLIERSGEVGRGVAYAERSREHELNVRAKGISAWADRPSDFADWYAARGGHPAAFASRGLYGDYLGGLLAAQQDGVDASRLVVDRDAAIGVNGTDHDWTVSLQEGGTIAAEALVLAIGNLPPRAPAMLGPGVAASPAYVGDPWSAALDLAPDDGTVLVMGAGLTMVDVVLRLARRHPRLRFLAISRTGRTPLPHLPTGPDPDDWAPADGASPLTVLRDARARVRAGAEWHAVVDGLRWNAQRLWRGWHRDQRRRFLRHGLSQWTAHRHRIALTVADEFDALHDRGALEIRSGRFVRIETAGTELAVTWHPKGTATAQRMMAALVVNCTGPNADLARVDDPLLASLVGRHLVRSDALRLGLDTDDDNRLVRADGEANETFFAVGPITRGAFWEITSVPDIRVQAAECARRILTTLHRKPHVA